VSYALDLQSWVRAAGDAIIAAGTDGKIILWNPAAERIFGFTAEAAYARKADWPYNTSEDDFENDWRVMRERGYEEDFTTPFWQHWLGPLADLSPQIPPRIAWRRDSLHYPARHDAQREGEG